MLDQQVAVGQIGQGVVIGEVLDAVRGGEHPLALVLQQPGHHADADQALEQEVERPEVGGIGHRADLDRLRHDDHQVMDLVQPVEQEGAGHQSAAEARAVRPAEPDPPGRGEDGGPQQEGPQPDPHQEADLRSGIQGQGDGAGCEQQEEGQHGTPEAAGEGLRGGGLVRAEEHPRGLPVAGGDGDQRSREARRRRGWQMGSQVDRERVGEQPDAERPPAPSPGEQIGALVEAMKAHQHDRQNDGAQGLRGVACENHKR